MISAGQIIDEKAQGRYAAILPPVSHVQLLYGNQVKTILMDSDAMNAIEIGNYNSYLVGMPIIIAVVQGNNIVLSTGGNVDGSVRCYRYHARIPQALGKQVGAKAIRQPKSIKLGFGEIVPLGLDPVTNHSLNPLCSIVCVNQNAADP